MTICYFSAQYLPTVGGVERYTWNLARCTVAAGHRAIVVTSALPNLPEHEIDGDGIEIYRLPVWPVMNGRFPVIKPGARFHALTAQIWAQKLDFCVVQTRMYTQSVWAARAAKRRGIPMLVIDHSTGYMPMGNGLLGACGRLYEQVACRLVRGTGAPFYGVSAAAYRWLHTFGITAAGTMPNAIDPAALEQEAAHAPDWRTKLNLGDRKIVLFVGRLIPEKGAGLLAQAVAQAARRCSGGGWQRSAAAGSWRTWAVTPGALPHGCGGSAAAAGRCILSAHPVCRGLSHHLAGSRGLPLPHRVHPYRWNRGAATGRYPRHCAARPATGRHGGNHPRRAADPAG